MIVFEIPRQTMGNIWEKSHHYGDVIIGAIASQITSLTIVYSAVYSYADQRKHQSSASLAFVCGIYRGPVNSPHKWPVTRKMFPFDDVIMRLEYHAMETFTECGLTTIGAWISNYIHGLFRCIWWRHQMETFSALLAICAGKFTGDRGIPCTKAGDAELGCFLWFAPE